MISLPDNKKVPEPTHPTLLKNLPFLTLYLLWALIGLTTLALIAQGTLTTNSPSLQIFINIYFWTTLIFNTLVILNIIILFTILSVVLRCARGRAPDDDGLYPPELEFIEHPNMMRFEGFRYLGMEVIRRGYRGSGEGAEAEGEEVGLGEKSEV